MALRHNYGPNIIKVLNDSSLYPEMDLVYFDGSLCGYSIDYIELHVRSNDTVAISYYSYRDIPSLIKEFGEDKLYTTDLIIKYGCSNEVQSFIFSCGIQDTENKLYYKLLGGGNKENKVVLWPPNKIPYAYLESNYYKTCGTLGNSCMRQKDMQKALNFYVQNADGIVVVVDCKNKIKARALFWNNVIKGDNKFKGVPYLDRVYCSEEKWIVLFDMFAKENDYATFTNHPKDILLRVENINLNNITHLPYADTFRYLDIGSKTLYSKQDACYDCIILTSTRYCGYVHALDPDCVKEVLTGNYISKKDSVYVKQYDGYVSDSNIANIGGKYYSIHDAEIVRLSNGLYCLLKDTVKECFTDNIIDISNSILIDKKYVANINVTALHGKQYSKFDPNIIKYEGRYYHISQCFKATGDNIEGGYVPKECALIIYDLIVDEEDNVIFSSPRYYPATYCPNYFKLSTGEYIRDISDNKKLVLSRNKKYYIKKYFQLPDKNQMRFSFMRV